MSTDMIKTVHASCRYSIEAAVNFLLVLKGRTQ